MDVKSELKKEQDRSMKKEFFWGKLVSVISIINGFFLLYHDNIMANRLDQYLLGVDEDIFGWALLIFGSIKIVGVIIENNKVRAISVILLSSVWAMLFAVSVLWSFGIGYPSNEFLTNGLMLVVCLRVSFKGVFNGVD